MKQLVSICLISFLFACSNSKYDTIIKNGLVYDGNGGAPYKADLAIKNDTIAFIGDLSKESATNIIDAKGMAITPGFINMLSWAPTSLIIDGNSQGDIRQGVTLEVFGEGGSMGPLNAKMKKSMEEDQTGPNKLPIAWNTLGEYMHFMEKRGISCNIASFVGATTIRENIIGEDNRAPTPAELESLARTWLYLSKCKLFSN